MEPPPGFHEWDIDMNNYQEKIKWGEMVGRELQKRRWEVHLPTLILWYDQNTYYYSDFKLRLE
jgi:hypothetical protein